MKEFVGPLPLHLIVVLLENCDGSVDVLVVLVLLLELRFLCFIQIAIGLSVFLWCFLRRALLYSSKEFLVRDLLLVCSPLSSEPKRFIRLSLMLDTSIHQGILR